MRGVTEATVEDGAAEAVLAHEVKSLADAELS